MRGTEWKHLVDLASPAFFDVLPASALRRATRGLAARWWDRAGFVTLRAARDRSLAAASIPIRVGRAEGRTVRDRRERGQRVLELYFHQLLVDERAILDLRFERFAPRGDGLSWNPRPLWVSWDPGFVSGLRDVYAGFYDPDDARFTRGLEGLGIECARETFLEHFGPGAQRAVAFRLAGFTDTFHRTFVRCRRAGAVLHPDFVPLGLYLATLYAHLERLGGAFDVRAAYERARDSAGSAASAA